MERLKLLENLGKLFEAGFLKGASLEFKDEELAEVISEKVEKALLELLETGVERVVLERFLKAGEASFEGYFSHLKSSLYPRLGRLELCSIEPYLKYKLKHGEVAEALAWENADFIAYLKGEKGERIALILELTLSGATAVFHYLALGQIENALKRAGREGIRLPVNYLKEGLVDFASEVAKALEGIDPLNVLREEAETVKFVQVLGYTLSYYLHHPKSEETDYIFLGVVSPLYPNPEGLFKAEGDGEEASQTLKRLKGYYARKRNYGKHFFSPESLLKEALKPKLLKEELGSIKSVRDSVKEEVLSSKRGKAYFLLHPAGAGKTTQTLNLAEEIRKEGKPVLYVYFAPRKAVVEEKMEEFERRGGRVFRYSRKEEGKGLTYGGYRNLSSSWEAGKLATLQVEVVNALLKGEECSFSGIFETLQSVARTVGWRGESNTARYLEEIVRKWLKSYPDGEVIVVIDEITGSNGGVHALFDIAGALEEFKEKVRLFVLDANLLCGFVLKKYLDWVKNFEEKNLPAPELLIKVREEKFRETLKGEVEVEGFPFECLYSSMPAFVGEELTIKKRALFLKGKRKNKLLQAAELLADSLEEKTFVYVQDRELLEYLSLILTKRGNRVLLITSRTPKKKAKEEEWDFVLATSSASRGIDVPFNRGIFVIPSFSPEVQLAELYQAVSRLRRGEEREGAKEVELVWIGEKESEGELFRASKILSKAEEIVLSYALKEGALKRRLVALPPAKPHRGDDAGILPVLNEIEDTTGVLVYSSVQGSLALQIRENRERGFNCFPLIIYNYKSAEVVVPYGVLVEAEKRVRKLKEEGKIPPEKAGEYLELINGLKRSGGRVLDKLPVAVHQVITDVFTDKLDGKRWNSRLVNRMFGEWIGTRATISSSGVLAFLLKGRKTSCYGGTPRIPIEILD